MDTDKAPPVESGDYDLRNYSSRPAPRVSESEEHQPLSHQLQGGYHAGYYSGDSHFSIAKHLAIMIPLKSSAMTRICTSSKIFPVDSLLVSPWIRSTRQRNQACRSRRSTTPFPTISKAGYYSGDSHFSIAKHLAMKSLHDDSTEESTPIIVTIPTSFENQSVSDDEDLHKFEDLPGGFPAGFSLDKKHEAEKGHHNLNPLTPIVNLQSVSTTTPLMSEEHLLEEKLPERGGEYYVTNYPSRPAPSKSEEHHNHHHHSHELIDGGNLPEQSVEYYVTNYPSRPARGPGGNEITFQKTETIGNVFKNQMFSHYEFKDQGEIVTSTVLNWDEKEEEIPTASEGSFVF